VGAGGIKRLLSGVRHDQEFCGDGRSSGRRGDGGGPIEAALHLRVLAAILGGHAGDARVEKAHMLAQEIYELELDAALEDYRSS
jgi:hypothetical protein